MHKYLFYVQMYYIFAPVLKAKRKKKHEKTCII